MKNPSPSNPITRRTVIKTFAALGAVAFVLRIFYASYLFEDDGLWFAAGEELLRGKALYREIYFDKPPVLPLLYALLFKSFGVHILTIRLFTILYSVGVAFLLYRFGSLLYYRRQGLAAATLFVVFSTTYTTGHFQGLNTDFLMTGPYTLAAYWFVQARWQGSATKAWRRWLTFTAGVAAGVAFQTNPKAIFCLLFFALCCLFFVWLQQRSVAGALLLSLGGFLAGVLPFLLYFVATASLSDYWVSVWTWGAKYATYYSWGTSLAAALRQSLGYFALNNLLLVGLVFVVLATLRALQSRRQQGTELASGADSIGREWFAADVVVLLWFLISSLGMSVGGRFFGHYFFQILPALCLLGGRGITGLCEAFASKRGARRLVFTFLLLGFLITLVRFHSRTALLARDWVRGSKSEQTREWFHERLNGEERLVAAYVKEGTEMAEEVETQGLEAIRRWLPAKRPDGAREDHLFIWGYRPEIYFWSGLHPASRFLSTQPLTGVPADVHFFTETYTPVLEEEMTAAYREQLLRDLQANPPRYIVDELGFYNGDLAITSYPDLRRFLDDYKLGATKGRMLIYYRLAPKEKKPAAIE